MSGCRETTEDTEDTEEEEEIGCVFFVLCSLRVLCGFF
jgi:hypothetical protein